MKKIVWISNARVISVIMIVCCHILQAFNNVFSFHLNSVIYTFMCISGILFGMKPIVSYKDFYIKRLKRILIPYYLWLLVIVILYCFMGIGFTFHQLIKNIFVVQYFSTGLDQVGHLWYISCYVFCCILTPFIYKAIKSFKNSVILWSCIVINALLIAANSYVSFNTYAVIMYLDSFVVTVLISEKRISPISNKTVLFILFAGLFAEFIRIINDYCFKFVPGICIEPIKCIFAVSVLAFCYLVLSKKEINRFIDKISYEIYLSHHLFCLGCLSFNRYFTSKILSIIYVIVLTVLSAVTLNYMSEYLLNFRRKKNG